jgi:hypothetical protein
MGELLRKKHNFKDLAPKSQAAPPAAVDLWNAGFYNEINVKRISSGREHA